MAFHPQPLVFLLLGLVAGTLLPFSAASPLLFLALGLSALLCLAAIARPRCVPLVALVAAAVAAGSAFATAARVTYHQHSLPLSLSEIAGPVVLEGTLGSDARVVDDEMRFEVNAVRVVAEGVAHDYRGRVRVFLRTSGADTLSQAAPLEKGDEIRAWVELRRPEPVRTPGGFDQAEWAMRKGFHAFATCKSERLLKVTRKSARPRGLIDRGRDRMKNAWRHVPHPLNRAVTTSMVLGDEDALDMKTRDDFRAAGLLHLLVVSGSQVAALIVGLRRAMPAPLRLTWTGCLIECSALLAYCLLAGAEDSIVRATLMAMAFAVSVRVDLDSGGINFLAASALVLFSFRPLDVLDPGAQMSYAATLALVIYAGPISRKLEALRMPGLLADVVAATLVASIAVTPLTLMHFHRWSLVALPANLIAAPLAVLLLYASLGTVALDLLFSPAAWLCATVSDRLAEALRFIAHHAAVIDPDWRGPSPPLALMIGLLGLIACSGWRRGVIPAAGLSGALLLSGPARGDGRLHLWFLDVGQGDSVLIETPNGRAAAIDAGPAFLRFDAGERVVGAALWHLGYRRLDFLGLTHRHADHEGGAAFLARHFKPGAIYVNGVTPTHRGFETQPVQRGDSWTVDGVSFRVLSPDPAWPLPSRDENSRSLVIEVRYGATSFLLTGDATVITERSLDIGDSYSLVKVGHHGAATSSSDRLVRISRPQLAIVSVGSRNRFSHPSPKVIERWGRVGAQVWRTDLHRTLHVTSDGTRLDW